MMQVKSASASDGKAPRFQPTAFFKKNGNRGIASAYRNKQIIFLQGEPGTDVLYIHKGRVKLTVLSKQGKEATIGLLADGDFFGEECLAADQACRSATAVAMSDCSVFSIGREEMARALHKKHAFANFFVSYLLKRNIRIQEDLVDQLFNSTEKRLARVLLLLSHFGGKDKPAAGVPKVSQEALAEMVGTSRTRVNYFMNKFRKLGFIEYNGALRVHDSLVNILLHD
jgi:CRP/FNR family cyclic AMP-dependent transcriptional regulator